MQGSCPLQHECSGSGVFRQREVVSRKLFRGLYEVNSFRRLVLVSNYLGSGTTHGVTDTLFNTSTRGLLRYRTLILVAHEWAWLANCRCCQSYSPLAICTVASRRRWRGVTRSIEQNRPGISSEPRQIIPLASCRDCQSDRGKVSPTVAIYSKQRSCFRWDSGNEFVQPMGIGTVQCPQQVFGDRTRLIFKKHAVFGEHRIASKVFARRDHRGRPVNLALTSSR